MPQRELQDVNSQKVALSGHVAEESARRKVGRWSKFCFPRMCSFQCSIFSWARILNSVQTGQYQNVKSSIMFRRPAFENGIKISIICEEDDTFSSFGCPMEIKDNYVFTKSPRLKGAMPLKLKH